MIDFIAGLIVGAMLFALVAHILVVRARHKEAWYGTEAWALETFATTLIYDCPNEHAVSGKLCDTGPNGVWVCLERIKYREEMEAPLYDVVLSHDETPDEPGVWEEVEIQNDCGYGCKIYEHKRTGRRALMHNSAYGCRQ